MCSGKSRIGQVLAQKLKWQHIDTDKMIEKDVGASVAEIIRKQGEAAFREVEKKVVKLVSLLDSTVISTGGGVPLSAENMKSLSDHGRVVWLQVKPETVLQRAGDLTSRPLIDPKDPLTSIQNKMKERESHYSKAHLRVAADEGTPEQLAEHILSLCPVLPS